MANSTAAQTASAVPTYEQDIGRFTSLLPAAAGGAAKHDAHREEMMYSPLVSLAVKHTMDYKQSQSHPVHSLTEKVQAVSLGYSSTDTTDSEEDTSSSDANPPASALATPTPIEFTSQPAFRLEKELYPQYALLGCNIQLDNAEMDPFEPIMLNTNSPTSAFICGSQGSGKSYTLACMMENCLLQDHKLGALKKPLAGVLFHYDTDNGGTIAEALSLCSRGIKVKVLVSRTNYHKAKASYEAKAGEYRHNLSVLPLLLQDHQLTNERMQRMMSMTETEGKTPLYMDVIMRILRDMALDPFPFSMLTFERLIGLEQFDRTQENFLKQRMDLLKSFCASGARSHNFRAMLAATTKAAKRIVNSHPPIPDFDVFAIEEGTLTIIDLSDPSISTSTACMLFDICLSVAKEKPHASGLVIALDEAHKYIDSCSAATAFTNSLLTTIREQRHKGVRVIIATQEPTISEKLLDLCSVTIVHRFTSPDWFQTLKKHLSGVSDLTMSADKQKELFKRIVALDQGESLVFSPSSYVKYRNFGGKATPVKLGEGILHMKTRLRVGEDGGRSAMAVKTG